MSKHVLTAAAIVCALACNQADSDGETAGAGGSVSQGPGSGPGAGPANTTSVTTSGAGGGDNLAWTELVADDWALDPFSEDPSRLATRVLDRDIYVGAIRPIAPQGTHHTVLGRGNLLSGAIYASGVGTEAVIFPPGVGLKLKQGDSLKLQLHIYNPVGNPLNGRSGIEIVEVTAADVVNEADIFLPGPLHIDIPPNQQATAQGTCTLSAPQTIFALFPHMHQLGTHFKTTLITSAGEMVLHDEAYDFTHQTFRSFSPINLNAGDKVRTECTYLNTTANQVGWGESSNAEMCFSILFRYGAAGGGFCQN